MKERRTDRCANYLGSMRPTTLLLFAAMLTLPGCAPGDKSPTPAAVTPDQFKQLAWIAGRWQGAEAGGAPFFESYRMIDDSTIASTTWADASFSSATDSSRISLRNGEVTNGPGYVVTAWSENSVHFEPRGTAVNSFTWQQESADRWTARLQWTQDGKPSERTYIMTRVAE